MGTHHTCTYDQCLEQNIRKHQNFFNGKGGGGLICVHASILFLLCMVNAFILTPIKVHLFILKSICRSQDSTLTYSIFVTIPALYFAYMLSLK